MRIRPMLSRFAADARGVAGIEMALVGTLVIGALLNVVEVGRYAYTTAQVAAASQAGAHAALVTCDPTEVPVATNCTGAAARIQTAIQGTSLADAVALDGPLVEGWYCVNQQGGLQLMAAGSEPKPQDCADAGTPSARPAFYLRVRAAHDYEPIFPGLTLTETFPDIIVRTAWMRMR